MKFGNSSASQRFKSRESETPFAALQIQARTDWLKETSGRGDRVLHPLNKEENSVAGGVKSQLRHGTGTLPYKRGEKPVFDTPKSDHCKRPKDAKKAKS